MTCASCDGEIARRIGRLPLVIGSIGLPLLIAGILGFDLRLCLAGGVIAAVAVLTHVMVVVWQAAA